MSGKMRLPCDLALLLKVVLLSFVAIVPGVARAAEKDPGPKTIVLESQTIELPRGNLKFPGDAPGARVATTYCVMCHSRGMIDAQPLLSRDQWKTEIHKMRSSYGCPLSESMDEELEDFLFRYSHKTATASASK